MTDGDMLHAAILADPDDDTARLAYADWLDENGQPERAEFIRVQVGLAGDPRCLAKTPCRDHGGLYLCTLRDRERKLFKKNRVEWFHTPGMYAVLHDRQTAGVGGAGLVVRRGFADTLCCTHDTFVGGPCPRMTEWTSGHGHKLPGRCILCDGEGRRTGIASAVFAAHPVTRVVLTDREPQRGGELFRWVRRPGDFPDELDSDLFDCLMVDARYGSYVTGRPGDWAAYPTVEAAQDEASAACVRLGRERAGLPAQPQAHSRTDVIG